MNEFDKVNRDAALYGTGFMINGKHVPVEDVVIMTKPELPDCRLCENHYPNRSRGNQCAADELCINGKQYIYEQPIRLYEIDDPSSKRQA